MSGCGRTTWRDCFRDLEMPLAEVLAEMELAGMTLDVAALERALARARASVSSA